MSNDPFNTPPVANNAGGANPYASNQIGDTGPPRTSGKAIASLVLGLVSFVCNIFAGVPALIFGFLALGDISRSNGVVKGKGLAITGIVCGSLGSLTIFFVLIGMMLPAVQQVRTAARRTQSLNNIRQMNLAMLNHESAQRAFPTSSGTADGTGSGLSWRVHILPYLQQDALYQQFHLDEPWDSPHNLTLVDQMPETLNSPNIDLAPGQTVYQVPTTSADALDDENWRDVATMFVDGQPGMTFDKLTDGSSNTILIVEANAESAVIWTQPADLVFDPADPTRDLGANWTGDQVIVGFADGSTHTIGTYEGDELWKALFTPAGGESIDIGSSLSR